MGSCLFSLIRQVSNAARWQHCQPEDKGGRINRPLIIGPRSFLGHNLLQQLVRFERVMGLNFIRVRQGA